MAHVRMGRPTASTCCRRSAPGCSPTCRSRWTSGVPPSAQLPRAWKPTPPVRRLALSLFCQALLQVEGDILNMAASRWRQAPEATEGGPRACHHCTGARPGLPGWHLGCVHQLPYLCTFAAPHFARSLLRTTGVAVLTRILQDGWVKGISLCLHRCNAAQQGQGASCNVRRSRMSLALAIDLLSYEITSLCTEQLPELFPVGNRASAPSWRRSCARRQAFLPRVSRPSSGRSTGRRSLSNGSGGWPC